MTERTVKVTLVVKFTLKDTKKINLYSRKMNISNLFTVIYSCKRGLLPLVKLNILKLVND